MAFFINRKMLGVQLLSDMMYFNKTVFILYEKKLIQLQQYVL